MMEVVAAMGAPAGVRGSATPSAVLFFPLGKGDIVRMRTAPQSLGCRDPGFSDCRLCKGGSSSDWVPLCDPVRTTPHAFSPCNTNRKLRWRRGTAGRSTAEVAEANALQATEGGSSKRVVPKYLIGKSHADMEKIVYSFGGQKYRAKQLYQLIYTNKMRTIQECAQIPKELRDAMELAGWRIGRSPTQKIVTSIDGTVKLLLRLEDDKLVETVGVPVKGRGRELRLTACVSSQVGCALKCSFCATGKGGLGRNLKSHEIVDQVLAIEDVFRQPVTSVAFMGMGEPLMNIGAVLDAHRTISKELKIAQPMIRISTVGVPNTLRRLAAHKLHSPLAVSLHAANQELRSEIVPSAKRYPLETLMEDCRHYYETTKGRLSFEYTLLAGVNDQREHAEELATLLHHWNFNHINLIQYNPIAHSSFERPSKAEVLAFMETLAKRRVTARVRLARGLDANAACGQLRNEFQKFPLQSPTGAQREAL